MKYYIIAGEASGDLHGANLVKALKNEDKQAEIRCWGGELMQAQGATLVKHYRETAYMGLFEVVAHARTIAKNFQFCFNDIATFAPDVVVLIDYPGFNLRVAKFAKENGIKVFYYISPKVWVWNEKRVKKIKLYVDRMFVIFPFEKDFYSKKHNYEVDYVGNPLIDAIEDKKAIIPGRNEFVTQNGLANKPIVAMLPGSRKQEISRLIPIMASIVGSFPDYQFVIAGTTALDESLYKKYLRGSNITILFNKTYELLSHSEAAIVASGTATLETALFNIPQVVCYKLSNATYLGKPFFPIKYFSLVNIIMDKTVVKELLQYHLVRDITQELNLILHNMDYRNQMLGRYRELREKCGGPGASKKAAELMVHYLQHP
jgi:lipid-A-disaccharide synthase